MPTISKIRFTNVVYEGGNKRYTDEIFHFQGENSAIVLENGGGKTVFIQAAIQAILPHESLANRKIKETFHFDDGPAHIAIEWIKNDKPRVYALTAVTIFPYQNGIDSIRYVYEYGPNDENRIEKIPFTHSLDGDKKRIAGHSEMKEYYTKMTQHAMAAKTFPTIIGFTEYIEQNFQIIANEWKSIVKINSAEGDVEKYFDECQTEKALYEKLLIPTVEKSLTAFNDKQFADIFEQQRDKFQMYKLLNEQLKEYEVIQKELNRYVHIMEQFHVQQQQYLLLQMRAKAFEKMIQKEIEEIELKWQQLQKDDEQHQLKRTEYELKEKSYDIAKWQQDLQQITEEFNNAEQFEQKLYEVWQQEKLRYANVKFSRITSQLKKSRELEHNYTQQLQQIDEELSETELLQQLEEIEGAIHGHFIETKDRFDKIITDFIQQQNRLESHLQQQQEKVQSLEKKSRQFEDDSLKNNTQVNDTLEQINEIEDALFENDFEKEQPIAELRQSFGKQAQQLDDYVITLKSEVKQLVDTQRIATENVESIQQTLQNLGKEESTLNEKVKQFEQAEIKMQQELADALPEVTRTQQLKLNEQSIIQQVEQIIEKRNYSYMTKLNDERLTLRHVDDYGEQHSFFADSYIAKQLDDWKQQFTYLETAVQYFAQDDISHLDPSLLAITLITNEHERALLEDKLKQSAANLTYPIQVWSLQEATSIANKEKLPAVRLLEPNYWITLSSIEQFKQWQQTVNNKAQQAKHEREVAEKELLIVKQIQSKLKDYYSQYTLTMWQQLQSDKKKVNDMLYKVTQQKNEEMSKLTKIAKEIELKNDQIQNSEEQQRIINGKLKQILQLEKLLRNKQQLEEQGIYIENNLTVVANDLKHAKQELADVDAQLKFLVAEKSQQQNDQAIYFAERGLFKQVTHSKPIFTDESYEALEQKHGAIGKQIEGFSENRSTLQRKINDERKQQIDLQQNLDYLKVEEPLIDEQFSLPLNANELLLELPLTVRAEEEKYKESQTKRKEIEKEMLKIETVLQHEKEKLDDIIAFTEPLPIVQIKLMQEQKLLNLQEQQLRNAIDKTKKEFQELQTLHQQLQKEDGRYRFLAPQIVVSTIPVEEQTDFQYRRHHYVNDVIKQLEQQLHQVEQKQQSVEKAKRDFQNFCHQQISDFRLRESVVQGIHNQTSYNDVIKHKENVEKTVHSSRQVAESTLKKYNDEMESFINHIHVHLRKLVNELKIIPRKTRIQVEGESIPIYQFSIPEWSEEEGVGYIRKRVEWVVEQLENDRYRGDDGKEDRTKVRSQLEQWFSSTQLLRAVTQNQEWRVSCKKVTNDNRVSKGYESWNRSNAWSGGEKWSKNMALFLGILNYVAEKRQHLQTKNRSRTVIVDNPFGKASSEHVLSPVFFIAEQLGFQIIALTAHVEGKFLHDYFPIVYSCRLRPAVGSSKLIIETQKSVQHALFQDRDEKQEEIVTIEQLELF